MPLGFERLNERVQRPNKNINFIKPLEGPDKAIAQDILERVAAVVYPIMKKNHLYVMALEEFPPNREFWGRNFNAGEIIQLVLKSPHNGMWLPIPMIQGVMLHELAHNKEMNHSRRFHKHRLGYVSELAELKGKGYTGEGFWGKGNALHPSVDLTGDRQIPKEELPEDLCGGVYRRVKKKKRDSKPKVDYQEQKRRRIIKKFGSLDGNTVGADEDLRQELEGGKKPKGKPRVAASARGRDLRAEAALKRFETQKKEETKKEESETESESESEGDGDLVKLEDDEVDMKAMMEEMSALACGGSQALKPSEDAFPEISDRSDVATASGRKSSGQRRDSSSESENTGNRRRKKKPAVIVLLDDDDDDNDDNDALREFKKFSSKLAEDSNTKKSERLQSESSAEALPLRSELKHPAEQTVRGSGPQEQLCSACQVSNDRNAAICLVCSNVLRDDVKSWKCNSESCKDSGTGYRNSMDVSYCGVCGGKR